MKPVIIVILVFAAALAGCSGTPAAADAYPVIRSLPVGQNSDVLAYDDSELVPQVNPDGSLTMFTFKGVPVKMMPMTDTRSKGALVRSNEEFVEQISKYETALQANPQDYDSCIMLAGLYIDRSSPGDADLAIKYSDMALAISKDNSQALYARGLAYTEKGENAKALSDLQEVMKYNVQSTKGAHYIMGMIHYKEKNVDAAIESFEKVAALDPDFVDTREILDVLYSEKN